MAVNERDFTMNNNIRDQFQFFPYGNAIETFGLVNIAAINAFGLVTRGFIWQAYDIWTPSAGYTSLGYAGIATGWTASLGYSSITTTWSAASGASISTTWTNSYFNELPNVE